MVSDDIIGRTYKYVEEYEIKYHKFHWECLELRAKRIEMEKRHRNILKVYENQYKRNWLRQLVEIEEQHDKEIKQLETNLKAQYMERIQDIKRKYNIKKDKRKDKSSVPRQSIDKNDEKTSSKEDESKQTIKVVKPVKKKMNKSIKIVKANTDVNRTETGMDTGDELLQILSAEDSSDYEVSEYQKKPTSIQNLIAITSPTRKRRVSLATDEESSTIETSPVRQSKTENQTKLNGTKGKLKKTMNKKTSMESETFGKKAAPKKALKKRLSVDKSDRIQNNFTSPMEKMVKFKNMSDDSSTTNEISKVNLLDAFRQVTMRTKLRNTEELITSSTDAQSKKKSKSSGTLSAKNVEVKSQGTSKLKQITTNTATKQVKTKKSNKQNNASLKDTTEDDFPDEMFQGMLGFQDIATPKVPKRKMKTNEKSKKGSNQNETTKKNDHGSTLSDVNILLTPSRKQRVKSRKESDTSPTGLRAAFDTLHNSARKRKRSEMANGHITLKAMDIRSALGLNTDEPESEPAIDDLQDTLLNDNIDILNEETSDIELPMNITKRRRVRRKQEVGQRSARITPNNEDFAPEDIRTPTKTANRGRESARNTPTVHATREQYTATSKWHASPMATHVHSSTYTSVHNKTTNETSNTIKKSSNEKMDVWSNAGAASFFDAFVNNAQASLKTTSELPTT